MKGINKLSENNSSHKLGIIERVGDLVAAYVSNNHVAPGDLPGLIATVHVALRGLDANGTASEHTAPAVEKTSSTDVRKSIRPDGLISFIDGKSYKTLKRHLTKHGFTPGSYRERFGLPGDYPVVAASYSEKRSNLAKSLGLGQVRSNASQAIVGKPVAKGRKKAA